MELRLTLRESIACLPRSIHKVWDLSVTNFGRPVPMLRVVPCPLGGTRDLAVPLMCSGLIHVHVFGHDPVLLGAILAP